MLVLYAVLVVHGLGLTHLFTGRAAFLHLGAITATIMSANVFMVIIPNQKIVVADLIAGRKPDPKYGKIAKQRSLHNNYLTLPVLFLMLSNHYPLAFATAVQLGDRLAGVHHRRADPPLFQHACMPARATRPGPGWSAAILFIVIIWLSTVPKLLTGEPKVSTAAETLIASTHFPAVRDTVMGRCAMCHAAEPCYEGIYHAPKGVMLDSDAGIAEHGREIYLQAGRSHAMPPGNVTADHAGGACAARRLVRGGAEMSMADLIAFAAARCPSCAGRTAPTTAPPAAIEEDGAVC